MKNKLMLIAAMSIAAMFTGCIDPDETPAQNEANAFKENFADVLVLTIDTVELSDKDRVNDAITAFNDLSEEAQKILIPEKVLLNALKAMIDELEPPETPAEGAAKYRAAFTDVFTLTEVTVKLTDKPRVNAAIAAYNNLSKEVKNELTSEKNNLEKLSLRISELELPVLPDYEFAKMADSFVDSIGVNTHLGYTDTNYGLKWESAIKPRLVESGIRHIRDNIPRWFIA